MRNASVLLFVLFSLAGTQVLAQNQVLPASTSDSGFSLLHLSWPRPFVYGGLGLNGGGYAPMSGKIGSGLRIGNTHLIWAASAAYDNAHKSNDNTLNNTNGHERSLESSIYYRFTNAWFVGGGASWSQLSTTNYTKQDFHPSIGGGKDYFHKECSGENCASDWSFRLQVDYKLKGAEHVDARGCSVPNGHCTNELQGPMISFYLPSPAASGHLFWRENLLLRSG